MKTYICPQCGTEALANKIRNCPSCSTAMVVSDAAPAAEAKSEPTVAAEAVVVPEKEPVAEKPVVKEAKKVNPKKAKQIKGRVKRLKDAITRREKRMKKDQAWMDKHTKLVADLEAKL